jgi:plasmid stabilization system protein ParE
VKVVWTDTAKGNLRTIHKYIGQNSPAYADRMIDRLTNRSKQIGAFPMSGRLVPEFDVGQIREVFEGPYRIIYYIRPDLIEVIGVVHMSREI